MYEDILDGAMIVLAMYTINLFHPGFLLFAVVSRDAQAHATNAEVLTSEYRKKTSYESQDMELQLIGTAGRR